MNSIAFEKGTMTKEGTNFYLYDIALIHITKPFDEAFHVPSGTFVKPVCLIGSKKSNINEIDDLSLDQEISIIGMGWLEEKTSFEDDVHPLRLQHAQVKRVPIEKCFKQTYPNLKWPPNDIKGTKYRQIILGPGTYNNIT